MKRFGSILLISLTFAAGAEAQDRWQTSEPYYETSRAESDHWLGLGIGFRTDNHDRIDAQPTVYGQYLWFVTSNFGVKADIGYNNLTSLGSDSDARTFVYGFGMRLQPSVPRGASEPFYKLFIEFDVKVLRYDGTTGGRDFHETRPGFGLAVGLSIKIDKSAGLDLAIDHTFNSAESRPVYGPETGILPHLEEWPMFSDCFGGSDSHDLYNPTNLIVRYRAAL